MDTLSLPSFHSNFSSFSCNNGAFNPFYYYYIEGYNVLDTMGVFPHVGLIIIKKVYDFLLCKHTY